MNDARRASVIAWTPPLRSMDSSMTNRRVSFSSWKAARDENKRRTSGSGGGTQTRRRSSMFLTTFRRKSSISPENALQVVPGKPAEAPAGTLEDVSNFRKSYGYERAVNAGYEPLFTPESSSATTPRTSLPATMAPAPVSLEPSKEDAIEAPAAAPQPAAA